jgi:serine/threonine protein phosphatase PrpC
MRFLPGNAQHIGARHSQQDSFGFSDPSNAAFTGHGGFLAIVCDGMGGMEFGDEASRAAVKTFLEAYARKTPEENIPAALERSVREANTQVVELATRLGMKDGVGTTLVAAALHQNSLYYISVGDSGVFLCAPGEFRMINRAHVFANVLDAAVARGTMSREDAQTHPERESLTSYIGTETLEEIDRNIEPYPMHDGDTVLLASDGMFKTLSPEEIRACLAGDPQRWAEVLVAQTMAHKREYQDNVTVVSVTASDALSQTIPPTRPMQPAAVPMPAAPIPPPPPPKPAPAQAVPSQPAIEWPSGEHAAVPTPPSRSHPIWLLVVLLVIVAAGAAGWWYAKHVRANKPGASATPESGKGDDLPALRGNPAAGVTPVGATGAVPQQNPPGQNPDGSPADPNDGPPPGAPHEPGMPGGPPPMRRGPPPGAMPLQPLSDPLRKPEDAKPKDVKQ